MGNITVAEGIEQENWRSFLLQNEHLVFHTPEYARFIEEAFGCKYELLSVTEEMASNIHLNPSKEIRLILPYTKIKSRIFGTRIISTAFLEYGGFAGSENYIKEAFDYLTQKYSKEYNFLEIRGGLEKFDNVLSSKLIKRDLYKRFVLKLEDQETTWNNIQKWKRKAIKKALSSVEVKEVPSTDLDDFYALYCQNMHRFGSPAYSKQYFVSFYKNIVQSGDGKELNSGGNELNSKDNTLDLKDNELNSKGDNSLGKIYGAYVHGKLVSALLGFCFRERIHIIIAVSDPKFQEFRPNDALHWTFISWGVDHGYKWFDFGRVREGSGQFEYKQKWGPTLKELPSYYLLWKAKEIPFIDPSKHEFLVKIWKLLPLWFTTKIGMKLRIGLGI